MSAAGDAAASARAAEIATGTSQEDRFTLELEFVMALANPRYLHRACPPPSPLLFLPSRVARPPRGTPHPPSFAHPVIRSPLPPSPSRVADLATKGYFDDPAFLGYLDHLAYWTRPEYAKFVHYPHALYFLDQLKRPAFRRAMANPRAVEHVFQQQYFHWQRHRTAQAEAATANAPPEGPGGGGDDAR